MEGNKEKDTVKDSVIKEVERIIEDATLNCSVTEFEDKVDWYKLSSHKGLSENFIREFKDKLYWDWISSYQKLSEILILSCSIFYYFH